MRSAGFLGLAAAVLTLVSVIGRPVEAAQVLVFNSTRYVDSNQGPGYPEGSQESDNVQAALAALGHAVTTIAGANDPVGTCSFGGSQPGTLLASAAQYGAALGSVDAFLIPEQESFCYLPGEMPADVAAAWRNWVAAGGGLVIHSSEEARVKVDDLFFVLFGFRTGSVAGSGITTTKRPAAAGTQFASGPPTLPGNPSTGLVPVAGLPTGSISVYDNGTNASVAIIPFGSGKIVFLGWDWTKSNPPFTTDGQNGGWYPTILQGAIAEAAAGGEPGFLLTVTRNGTGSGTVTSAPAGIDCGDDCWQSYPAGTPVTLTATPDAGSAFAGWSGDADCADGAVTMTANRSCSARFDETLPGTAVLTITRAGTGSGTVSSAPAGIDCGATCSASFPGGTVVALTATPASGSTFGGWTGHADCADGAVQMTGNRACTATFTAQAQRLSVVVRGTDNGIYHNRFDGAQWLGWAALPGMTSDTPALASSGGMVELVVRGTDDHVYHNRFNGSGWLGWTALPGATSDAPALAVYSGVLHLVIRGTDDGVYHTRFNGQSWAAWTRLGTTRSTPALAVAGGGLHLVVRGLDNGLYHNRFNGQGWLGWLQMPGQTADDPVLAGNGTALDLAVHGTDNRIYLNRFDGTHWLGWTSPPGATLNAPALAAAGGRLDLVVRGTDSGIYHGQVGPSGWSGWTSLPGATADAPTLATAGTTLHLLLRGTDNGIYHNRLAPGGGWLGFSAVGGATPSRPAAVTE